jgi:hypothetical protein
MYNFPILAIGAVLLVSCNQAEQRAPSDDAPTAEAPAGIDTIAAPVPTVSQEKAATDVPPPALAVGIPGLVQGRWGLVAADCEAGRSDAKGLLLIGPETLKFYEARGTLANVKERNESRIFATYRYSAEGTEFSRDETLDVQDGGKTLIRREYGEASAPGVFKYARCP